MLKILIYSDNISRIMRLESVVKAINNVEIIRKANTLEACLRDIKEESFDLLILDPKTEKDLVTILSSKENLSTMSLLIANKYKKSTIEHLERVDKVAYFTFEKFKIVELVNLISEMVNEEQEDRASFCSEYIPINVKILKRLKETPCDFHIKLSADKYVKAINGNSGISEEFISKYTRKGLQDFYVRKEDFYRCADDIYSPAFLPEEKDFDNKIDYYLQSQEIIKEVFDQLGVNKNTVKAVDNCVDKIMRSHSNGELKALIEKYKYSPERYIYDHSFLSSVFAISICEKFGWINSSNFEKLVFACLVHDYGFSNPKLALLENTIMESSGLRQDVRQEILRHPWKMAELLSGQKEISSEVIGIIERHHEGHGEASYPKGLSSAHLSVLECVFIVAHEFTNQLYAIAFRPEKMDKAIDHVLRFCDSGNFRQIKTPFKEAIVEKYQAKKV